MTIIEKIHQYIRDRKVNTRTKRSSKWPKIRKIHLSNHPTCAACGSNTKVEVHHIVPFHIKQELELDSSNLISLCRKRKAMNCHLVFGHLGNFKNFNVYVTDTSSIIHNAIRSLDDIMQHSKEKDNESYSDK